jgi:hypothetical protein
MSIELLRQIAATPLPKSFTAPKDVDAVKILRQAGLIIALVDELPEGATRVLAITDKGRAELLRFHFPDEHVPRTTRQPSWLHLAAQRARNVLNKRGISGGRDS